MAKGNVFAYSALTTKIKAMGSNLFKDEEWSELAHCNSVAEAFSYLQKQPNYAQLFADLDPANVHRGEIEWLLNFSTYEDFTKIVHFAQKHQSEYLDLYFIRYEIITLKRYMRIILDPRQSSTVSVLENDFERHSKINTKLVADSSNLEEFINKLSGTKYFDVLTRVKTTFPNPTLFDYEMALDMYYFSSFWEQKDKIFTKSENEFITRSYGIRIDLLNLLWIYRCKAYYTVSNTAIYTFLLPINYKLKKDNIKQLVEAQSAKEVIEIANKTYYGKKHTFTTDTTLESQCEKIIDDVIRKDYKNNPYSLACITAYFHFRNSESAKIITALECIRYGYPPETVMEYIKRKGSSV